MQVPKPLTVAQCSVDELSQMLKERIDFMNENFYSDLNKKSKLCTPEEEIRIIAEISVLSASLIAGLLLSSI